MLVQYVCELKLVVPMWQLYIPLGSIQISQCCVYALFKFRQKQKKKKTLLVRVRLG